MMHAILSHGRGSNAQDPLMLAIAEPLQAMGLTCELVDDKHTQNPEKRTQLLTDRILAFEEKCANNPQPIVLIGHSLGGYASILASTCCPLIKGVILLAPALWTARYQHTQYPTDVNHICLIHGWRDVTVIPEHSLRFARSCEATCHLVDADHDFLDALDEVSTYIELFIDTMNRK